MDRLDAPSQSPPPPAYSEQEFDQKVLLASQLSQTTYQHQVQHEEDAWEVWDDAVFQEAAEKLNDLSIQGSDQSQTAGSSSTNNQSSESGGDRGIHPLRIHKKNPSGGSSSIPPGKPKPSWLAEAEGSTPSASGSSPSIAPVAPAYTTTAPSGLAPPPILPPNHYTNRELGTNSPNPTLTSPRYGQIRQHTESLRALPPLADSSFPPPPFSTDTEIRQPYSYTNRDVQHEPMFAPLASGPAPSSGARPTSMPVRSNRYDTHIASTHQNDELRAPYLASSMSRYSMSTSPSNGYSQYGSHPAQYSPSPGQPAANTYNGSLQPRSTSTPQIKVDLSVAYGKRPVTVTAANEPRPQQTFDAAAFYNSAVSAHFGSSAYSKPPVNSFGQARQSHQPLTSSSLYSLQQTTQLAPDRYNQLPPGSAPPRNPHNPMLQDLLIRSPTPTYPAGTTNVAPQMTAIANEGHRGFQYTKPHPMTQGQVEWAEPYNPYR